MESMDMESEKLFGEGLEVKTAPLRAKETTSRESILSARNASRYQFVLMNKNETGSGMGGRLKGRLQQLERNTLLLSVGVHKLLKANGMCSKLFLSCGCGGQYGYNHHIKIML